MKTTTAAFNLLTSALDIVKVAGFTVLFVPLGFVLSSTLLGRFGITDPYVALFGSGVLYLIAAPRIFDILEV